MPPKVLQHLMGHTDIKVTLDTYADVFDNFQSISVEKADSYLNQVGLAVWHKLPITIPLYFMSLGKKTFEKIKNLC